MKEARREERRGGAEKRKRQKGQGWEARKGERKNVDRKWAEEREEGERSGIKREE